MSAPRVGHTPLSRSTASLPVLPSQAPDNYFHYNQYHPTPEVFYTTDLAAADVRLRELRGPFMGLDMEWPYEKIQQDSFRFIEKIGKTAMIQVCDERLIVMLHLQDASSESGYVLPTLLPSPIVCCASAEDVVRDLPPRLIEIMADPTIYKCGVQVRSELDILTFNSPQTCSSLTSQLLTPVRRRLQAAVRLPWTLPNWYPELLGAVEHRAHTQSGPKILPQRRSSRSAQACLAREPDREVHWQEAFEGPGGTGL